MGTPQNSLVKDFNWVLNGIIKGEMLSVPTETSLDEQTTDVLNLLAQQPNPKRPADIRACRIEFARQLDGTHYREDQQADAEEWDELLRQVRG